MGNPKRLVYGMHKKYDTMQLKDGLFLRLVLGNGSCMCNTPTKPLSNDSICVFPFFRVPGVIDNLLRPITPRSRRADWSE